MNLHLDGKAFGRVGGHISTLGALVQLLGELPELENRVIQSISIDGDEFDEWEESMSVTIAPEAEVHVVTRSVTQVLMETAMTCLDYLPRLKEGAITTATRIHEARDQEALELIQDLFQGLEWYTEVLGHIVWLEPQEQERGSFRLSTLNNILEQLLSAWDVKDLTLLADLLEYELAPELDTGVQYIKFFVANLSTDVGN